MGVEKRPCLSNLHRLPFPVRQHWGGFSFCFHASHLNPSHTASGDALRLCALIHVRGKAVKIYKDFTPTPNRFDPALLNKPSDMVHGQP